MPERKKRSTRANISSGEGGSDLSDLSGFGSEILLVGVGLFHLYDSGFAVCHSLLDLTIEPNDTHPHLFPYSSPNAGRWGQGFGLTLATHSLGFAKHPSVFSIFLQFWAH